MPDLNSLVSVGHILKGLTTETFDVNLVSIIGYLNTPERTGDGRMLDEVARLIIGEALERSESPKLLARFCSSIATQITLESGTKNSDGTSVTGGQLLRQHIVERCEVEFRRLSDVVAASADDRPTVYLKGLSLVRFVAELFELRWITDRALHAYVKKLLTEIEHPEEEMIRWLCELLRSVGAGFDVPTSRGRIDVYFSRMRKVVKNGAVSALMGQELQVRPSDLFSTSPLLNRSPN